MLISACILFITFSVYEASHLGEHHEIRAQEVKVEADTQSLIYAHVLWRHGDRTPASLLPTDTKYAEKWKMGVGELTTVGMAQQYRLGKWLKKRYGTWLGDRFERDEVYIRSSDYNRTLMSAQANMAGLFPPRQDEEWDSALHWQPVPVHTVPRAIDIQLYEEAHCPCAEKELWNVWTSDKVKEITKENSELMTMLSKEYNISHFSLADVWEVYDKLFCEKQHNLTSDWPLWLNDSVFAKITELYDLSSQFNYHTEVLRRLRGGPLLKEVLDRIKSKVVGTLGEKPKFYAYSAHDTTLAAILATLGIFPQVFPLYATAILLELHIRKGQLQIELFHKNQTDSEQLFEYEIPGCGKPCTFDKLHTAMEKYIPVDWRKECGLPAETDVTGYIATICFLSLTTTCLAAILAFDIYLKYRHRSVPSTDGREPLLAEEEDTQ